MAIKIIDGVPGAGKTYYAVKHLLDTYFVKEGENYKLKKPVKIITNIDGFKLDHLDLDEVVKASGGAKVFFSKDFQEKVFEKHGPVVYLIDEAQMIFDRRFYDRDVFSWFEYHRHYGQSIYLVTQAAPKLPPDITSLVECVIRALPRSRSLTGREFRYNHVSGRDILKRDVILIKKDVFAVYKSASSEEVEKVKNPFIKIAIISVICVVVVMFAGWKYILYSWGVPEVQANSSKSQSPDTISSNQQSSPPRSPRPRFQSSRVVPQPVQKNDIIPHTLNYLAVFKKGSSDITILFNGRRYSLKTFPYDVEMRGTDLIAKIPAADYYYYFPATENEASTGWTY